MMRDVGQYICNCRDYKHVNTPRDLSSETLKPLLILIRSWQHVSIDFYSFSKDCEGYDAIFVVVNQLTKHSISIPCFKTTGAWEMAWLYMDRIYQWKGAPESIISDQGEQFISEFWEEICRILGVTLKLSTSEHPQTDGQTEIVNQHIKQRLRPFVNYY
jgi:hypothetical protein